MSKLQINSDLRRLKSGELEINNEIFSAVEKEILNSKINGASKIVTAFPRFVRTIDLTRFLVYHEAFKKIQNVHGSICDIGVLHGFSLFSLAHLSEIYEPRNYTRKIFGFDTFTGHSQKFHKKDFLTPFEKEQFARFTACSVSSIGELEKAAASFEKMKALPQFRKIYLVQGAAQKTIPRFVLKNHGLIISMIVLGTDIYKPSLAALKHLYPLMPRGGIVLIGAANYLENPGETEALQDTLKIKSVRLQRFSFSTKWSFFAKE